MYNIFFPNASNMYFQVNRERERTPEKNTFLNSKVFN